MEPTPLNVISLCRTDSQSCGACCWSPELSRGQVERSLSRHRDLAAAWSPDAVSRWQAIRHELFARGGIDLCLAVLLRIPFLGAWVRKRFAARVVCAFAAFEDENRTRVGCLLHPSRFKGIENRPTHAFALLPGFRCGMAEYLCPSCYDFSKLSCDGQREFEEQATLLDWFDYGTAVRALEK